MSDLRARVVDVVSQVTNAPSDVVAGSARFADIVSWDSLMHVNVVLGLEREFGVQFDVGEFVLIDSVDQAVRLVQQRRA